MEILLFALLWLFLESCYLKEKWITKILKKLGYYVLLLFFIVIFEVIMNIYFIQTIYLYWIQEYTFDFQSILNLFVAYILVPTVIIFIRLKLEKISFNKNFFRRFNIYLLIYVLAFVLTYIIWYYTWIITFKESFL